MFKKSYHTALSLTAVFTLSLHVTSSMAAPSNLKVVTKPTVSLKIKPFSNTKYKGMICPTKVRVAARLKSANAFSGKGSIAFKQGITTYGAHDVILVPNVPRIYVETFNLKPWNLVSGQGRLSGGSRSFQNQPGGTRPVLSQKFRIRYYLASHNKKVLLTPFKTVTVKCKQAK